MDREWGSLRSYLRSDLGPREGGVRDRSLVPFRAGERDRRSLFDGYPKKKNISETLKESRIANGAAANSLPRLS